MEYGREIGNICELPLKTENRFIVVGGSKKGAKVPESIATLRDIKTIIPNYNAYAVTHENSVIAWGGSGGDIDYPNRDYKSPDIEDIKISTLKNIKKVIAAEGAFVAITNVGSIVAWGDRYYCGSLPKRISVLKNITRYFPQNVHLLL